MSNFEIWWEHEGQEFLYALNTTTDDDIKLVAEIAWKNGAYCTEQAEQKPVGYIDAGDLRELCNGNERQYSLFTEDKGRMVAIYAAPVRTKELTDDEIDMVLAVVGSDAPFHAKYRAVIAADREKNRG